MYMKRSIRAIALATVLTLVTIVPGFAEVAEFDPGNAGTESGWCRAC